MILIATGETSPTATQQAIVFAHQLKAAGYDPVMDSASLPEDLPMASHFTATPFLRDLNDLTDLQKLVVIGAEHQSPEALNGLRKLDLPTETQVVGIGTFETTQDEIAAAARLSYVTGQTPKMVSLTDTPNMQAGSSICPCFGVETETTPTPFLRGQTAITVVVPSLEDPALVQGLQFLTTSRSFATLAYMSGKDKSEWMRMFQPGGHIYGISEILPASLSAMSDVLVLAGSIGNNQNALTLLNNHLVSGGAIIDVSADGEFEKMGLPVHRGPTDLAYLNLFLNEMILPNLTGIKETTKAASARLGIRLMDLFGDQMTSPKTPEKPAARARQIHMMPTNGIGLGHAQRCVQIANAMPKGIKPDFLAFPSCLPMITKAGFTGIPMIPRSNSHKEGSANDLANFARLRGRTAQGDVFVFDGGYVFDSVFRTIIEKKLASVWIRRGLWRKGQDNRIPMDREKYFNRVIVPREALESLNENLSRGAHIHEVGPIVRQVTRDETKKKELHKKLEKQFGLKFEKLVVTMLGSGVVHDMSANIQTICNAVEHRSDCLNLIVVWPSSIVPPERYSWGRSKVVQTMNASWLAAHADFVVSATGYNSFHEALYNKIPALFVPQDAQILDDQEARAEAAAKEGLAAFVKSGKLSQLDREMRRFLDDGKGDTIREALRNFELPEPGNRKAAELIEELVG